MNFLSTLLLSVICCIACNHSFSQADTLSEVPMVVEQDVPLKSTLFPKQYGPKKWKFILGLDARRSFFNGEAIKINGFRTGAEYKGVHRFGIGFYGLARNAIFDNIPVDSPGATDTSRVLFNVTYGSLFYERVFFKSRRWEFAFPTEFSGGSISGYYEDTSGVFKSLIESPFSALTVGFQTKFFIFSWLAPRVSIGYRFVFNTMPEVQGTFNRPYYSFGVQILLGELYRAVFKKEDE